MRSVRLYTVALLAIVAAGCATIADSPPLRQYEQEEGAFRGRWWSFYERGVWLSRNGYLEEAEADFRTALQGRSRDAWSARTYGLHFTEYFPNRELGVLLLAQGRLEEAAEYLDQSLARVDTARAHHYRDEVTRAKIAAGIIRDETPPTVGTEVPVVTAARSIPLAIDARDDVGVAEVRLAGRRLYQRGARPEASFLETVNLDEGEHRIAIEAVDLSNRVTTETVSVRVDTTAPTIAVFEPGPEAVTEAAQITLRVAAIDNFDIDTLTLDGQPFGTAASDRRIDGATTLALQPGENRFVLRAVDAAGNENQSVVRVYRGNREAAATKLWWSQHHAPERLRVASAGGQAAMAAVLASAYAAPDTPVRIDLRFPEIPDDTVYSRNEMPVVGRVTATAALQMVTVGGAAIPLPEEAAGAYIEFERRVALERGENQVAVEARDTAGNADRRDIALTADFLLTESPESKMPVAVLAAYGTGGEPAPTLRSEMETRVVDLRRFNVLTRDQLVLEGILTEQQISAELGDPAAALALGRVVPAQAFVIASVSAFKDGYTVRAQVVSTETGRIVGQPDTFVQDLEEGAAIRAGMEDIASQLSELFPRITGRLLVAQGEVVAADYTAADGVREGMYMLVLREGDDALLDADGRVLLPGTPQMVARARVTQVVSTATRGQVVYTEEGEAIAPDMYTLLW